MAEKSPIAPLPGIKGQWILCSTRPPTIDDSDSDGEVRVYSTVIESGSRWLKFSRVRPEMYWCPADCADTRPFNEPDPLTPPHPMQPSQELLAELASGEEHILRKIESAYIRGADAQFDECRKLLLRLGYSAAPSDLLSHLRPKPLGKREALIEFDALISEVDSPGRYKHSSGRIRKVLESLPNDQS